SATSAICSIMLSKPSPRNWPEAESSHEREVSPNPNTRRAISRSAELHSAVSQICNLQRARRFESPRACERLAECNSAIQQIENLRYGFWLVPPKNFRRLVMNSDSPQSPREELEARLTALLLGELSGAEAATMRRAIEQDAELAQLYERLERTINLVHEAAVSPIEHTAAPSTLLKLSEGNRQRLLQTFKTATPKEFTAPRSREMPWFIPMSIAAVAVAMIGSVALLPGFWSQFTDAKIPAAMVALSRRDSAQ